ncbi:MAG: NUDIX hydrolase [Sarcina sp.]
MNYLEQVKNYIPTTKAEISDKELILTMAHTLPNLLSREENKIAHITSSAFVVNKDRTKTLMIYHNIFDSWSFTGGHADGDTNLINVALKELKEEAGVKAPKLITNELISLDLLHVIGHVKKGEYISPHLHISFTYLVECSEDEILHIKEDENKDVAWVDINKIDGYTSKEPHMQIVFHKIISKLDKFK